MASGDGVDAIELANSESFKNLQDNNMAKMQQIGDEARGMAETKSFMPLESGAAQIGKSVGTRDKERKIGHRRVGVGGEITYKKIQTTQIMGSIQLGIQHAVGSLASKPERDLLMQDFMTLESTNFPHEGSNHTPAHHYSEFRFKNYAPIAFRYFRDLFGIQPDDYLMSMCSAPLRELSNPGASGSIFYLTEDDEFIIKTVQHKEGEFLQKLLPGYYMNLNQNPRTLLPKFFGLYCYQCNSKNVRLIAMNNLLPSSIKLHQKYDLKGSTYKRKASKSERNKKSPTFKDLDFMEQHSEGLMLEADTYNALVKTIQRDCRVLESFKIMDYSLLLAIHNLDTASKEKIEADAIPQSNNRGDESDYEEGMPENPDSLIQNERNRESLNRSKSINRQRLVAHSTAMESIQAECEPIYEEEDVPPGGIPARSARGERLLLFVGIIDILQSYRLKKKLEHTWKSIIHDGDTVSVHRPGFYAQRFQDFMAKTVFKKLPSPLKHSPSKRKSISRATRPTDGDGESDSKRPWHNSSAAGRHNGPGTSRSSGRSFQSGNAPSCSSSSSTPPPAFDDVMHSMHQPGHGEQVASQHVEGDLRRTLVTITHIAHSKEDSVSPSEVRLEARSNLSVDNAGRSHNWTPSTSTPRGSTPTWTEGTPSFTESSSSGETPYPPSPLHMDGKDTVEDTITNLNSMMFDYRQHWRTIHSRPPSYRQGVSRIPPSGHFSFQRQEQVSISWEVRQGLLREFGVWRNARTNLPKNSHKCTWLEVPTRR